MNREAIVRALIEALKDKSHKVRKAAAQALAEIGAEAVSAKDALAKAATDKFPSVREAAFRALGRVGRE